MGAVDHGTQDVGGHQLYATVSPAVLIGVVVELPGPVDGATCENQGVAGSGVDSTIGRRLPPIFITHGRGRQHFQIGGCVAVVPDAIVLVANHAGDRVAIFDACSLIAPVVGVGGDPGVAGPVVDFRSVHNAQHSVFWLADRLLAPLDGGDLGIDVADWII